MTAALKLMTLDPMGRRAEWARLNGVRESRKGHASLVRKCGIPHAWTVFDLHGGTDVYTETWERGRRVVCLTWQPFVDWFYRGSGAARLAWFEVVLPLRCRVHPPGIAWYGDNGPERRTMLVEIWRADAAPDFDL